MMRCQMRFIRSDRRWCRVPSHRRTSIPPRFSRSAAHLSATFPSGAPHLGPDAWRRQLDRNVRGGAHHARRAIGMTVAYDRFQKQKKLFGQHLRRLIKKIIF